MNSSVTSIQNIFRKEFNSFFASPAAWLFLGGFLIVTLFIFFWAEAFFARNIADMKPLFQWMPILLIFLVAALTMRSWSEERRSGTLENLMTSPVSPLQLVLGKFLASLSLVALALLLTLPLPITIAFLGPLDWGPVFGGYLASLFLAAAYIAIGLYMSSRTDNPIVSLILTVAVAGVFYLIGSSTLTTLFGHSIGGFLALLGSGSRFDSITRGVMDIRDLYYYLSIVGIFLTLNLLTLEKFRWAGNKSRPAHKQWGWLAGLAIANFILANLWLNPIGWARVDLTQGNIYSLSETTKQTLKHMQEPLLIRGYFSAKSHPLLEPLVPQIRDILKEYKVAGGDTINVEFVDPHTDQALEQEAAEKYGIRPVPFRMASRYQSGVVNSYFDLVIAYGDQYETLSFDELIEIKDAGEDKPEVLLNNPEYAITQAIRKVSNAYQAGGNVFASLQKPVTFHAYLSDDKKLPKALADLAGELKTILKDIQKESGNKFRVNIADPEANGGELAKKLHDDYGLSAQIASLFDPKPFWFYMLLQDESETIQVPLPAELDAASLKKSIKAAVQRVAPGYLKTVAIVTPPAPAMNPMMRMRMPGGKHYNELIDTLSDNVRLHPTDLKDGHVPADADMLLLLSPEDLDDKQLFAVDQFLMKGGSVVIASGAFDVTISDSLTASKQRSGLEDWLRHNGLTLADSMVLDPQNASLPIPVRRQLGQFSVREIKMMPYPHFPDIRQAGLNADNPMTASLGQLTLNWASPIEVNKESNKERQIIELAHSSENSWTSSDLNVLPEYQHYPDTGFRPEDKRSSQLLVVAVKGRFDSFFKGKKTPLLEDQSEEKKNGKAGTADANKKNLADANNAADKKAEQDKDDKTVVSSIIERSSDSARIILISSNSFASDEMISLASQGQGSHYTRPLEFIQNTVDWSLGDDGLMAIRSRAQFSRMLKPMSHSSQLFWEYLNYALAIAGLVGVAVWRRKVQHKKQAHYDAVLSQVAKA